MFQPLLKPYRLPELDYTYSALEPHISARTMELHHLKHHAAYVQNANTALEGLSNLTDKNDLTGISALEKELSFHLSGHILHSIFWKNLAPNGGGSPSGDLAHSIQQDFGSFDSFKAQMIEVASTLMGSGWAALVWEPASQRLMISQIYDHQSNMLQGSTPLMLIDAWEHAYYLQYENEKKKFFEAIWNLWNWNDIAARLTKAKNISW